MKLVEIRAVWIDKRFVEGECREGKDFAIIEFASDIVPGWKTRQHLHGKNSERVWPICLPSVGQKTPSFFQHYGWGLDEDQKEVDDLRYVTLKRRKCGEVLDFSDGLICTGSPRGAAQAIEFVGCVTYRNH
ncbi:hypothetical protein AB6A40_010088 [Gnathostoma spinigerum]|uniref:Uncharacterized protein n=1 Tax=Gnathostoma spinigerum TaxID=75299 RepID=A0ABD6EZ04_9BILA